jgi:hypothetical protein
MCCCSVNLCSIQRQLISCALHIPAQYIFSNARTGVLESLCLYHLMYLWIARPRWAQQYDNNVTQARRPCSCTVSYLESC